MSSITWNMRSPLQLQPARFLSAQLLRINDGGTGCCCFSGSASFASFSL
jgi:hypothetical protein